MAAPVHAAAPACAAGDYVRQAQALIGAYVDAKLFSGTVLVAEGGKPVLRQAFGMADQEWDVPNTVDTRFRIGSITKQFTATAILQLAEQGRLSIDDPVSKYYPDAPAAWAKITLRNLLDHTSGIPNVTAVLNGTQEGRIRRTPEEVVRLTRDKPLQFEPGTRFAYSNSGYVLLAYVVEKVSGQPYATYVRDHIFAPLGMGASGSDAAEPIIPHRAHGYQAGPGGWTNANFIDMSEAVGGGSLFSTVDDLLTWDQALYAAKPLKPASLQEMFTDQGHGYGLGWYVGAQSGHPRIWHNGEITGFAGALDRYPADGLTVIVLSNFQEAPADRIAGQLAGLCFGQVSGAQAIDEVRRIRDQIRSPGGEAALRRIIDGVLNGAPPYQDMNQGPAASIRARLTSIQALLKGFGALQSVTFKAVQGGGDVYAVVFANRKTEWQISMTPDGKIADIGYRIVP